MTCDRAIRLDFDEATNRIPLFGRSEHDDDLIAVIKNYRNGSSGSSNLSMVPNSGSHDLQHAWFPAPTHPVRRPAAPRQKLPTCEPKDLS